MGQSIVQIQQMGDALRSSGYKSIDSAVAEIVDNSIEAEAQDVLVIMRELVDEESGKKAVCEFGILDNGSGMDAIKLRTLNESIKNADITKPASKEGGYGVINVARRLKIMCQKVDMVYSYENGTRCFIELVMDEDYMDES